MRKIILNPVCFMLGFVIVLLGCAKPPTPVPSPIQSASRNDDVVHVSASRDSYTLDELVRGSDLIVEGTVVSIQETRAVGEFAYTDFQVDISQVLKSYPDFADKSIIVTQMGGAYQGRTQVIEGDDLFQVGDAVFLFLNDISDDPVNTSRGQTKYIVMMEGGRFQIKSDGTLDSPTHDQEVADAYRSKEKSVLEKDVLARVATLPTLADSLQQEVGGAFLIVEGQVLHSEARMIRDEDTENIYTFYSFRVDAIIQDLLVWAQKYEHKPAVFNGAPIKVGDVITIFEIGGRYQGKTERHSWAEFLRPDTRMLLFLGAMACSEVSHTGAHSPLCTPEQQESNTILYMLGSNRAVIGTDDLLKMDTHQFIGHFYNGKPKEQLEQDLLNAKVQWERALKNKAQPGSTYPFPPPPPPTETP